MREIYIEYVEHLYHMPTDLEKQGGLWVIRIGQNLSKPHYKVGPRVMDHYILHFIVEGHLLLKHGTEETLHTNDAFCIFPEMVGQYTLASQDPPLRMLWVAFQGDQAEALLEAAGIVRSQPYLRNGLQREVVDFFQSMRAIISEDSFEARMKVTSLIYELFHLLFRQTKESRQSNLKADWVQKSKDYMDLHYAEGIMVKDVAHFIKLDRTYFSKAFTSETGISPKDYLKRTRMHKAVQMLCETSYTVTQIALSTGFENIYAFTRAFTHFYGISPERYRNLHS